MKWTKFVNLCQRAFNISRQSTLKSTRKSSTIMRSYWPTGIICINLHRNKKPTLLQPNTSASIFYPMSSSQICSPKSTKFFTLSLKVSSFLKNVPTVRMLRIKKTKLMPKYNTNTITSPSLIILSTNNIVMPKNPKFKAKDLQETWISTSMSSSPISMSRTGFTEVHLKRNISQICFKFHPISTWPPALGQLHSQQTFPSHVSTVRKACST